MSIHVKRIQEALIAGCGWTICSLVLSPNSYAAEPVLTITKGQGVAVCEAYAKGFADTDANSFACLGDIEATSGLVERIRGPVTKLMIDFYDENDPGLKLYREAEAFIREHDINPAQYFVGDRMSEWRHSPEQLEAAERGIRNVWDGYDREGVIRWSNIDVDNDGLADKLMFLPACGRTSPQTTTSVTMSAPILLSPEGHVDARRTELLLREPLGRRHKDEVRKDEHGKTVPIADIFSGSRQGWFRFREQTYWDFWWYAPIQGLPQPKEGHVVKIFTTTSLKTRQVCELKINGADRVLQ
jgi:hypothetical protein